MSNYAKEYACSIEQPEQFWKKQSKAIQWFKEPQTILSQDEVGSDRWFAGGELNTAYLALDYHCENGRADQPALIYDSPVTGMKKTYTYQELCDQTAKVAGMLQELGVEKGDRVVIYMPMIPEAAMAMLACARIGAIHSVVFGGFAAHELQVRIEDAEPKVILSASCGIEVNKVIPYKPMIDEAIDLSSFKPQHVVVYQRPQARADMLAERDIDWASATQQANHAQPVAVKATDPLYILYTSGTTGRPKGVVRDNGGHAVAMRYSMDVVYNMTPGEVFWAASDVGWVVGHSYIVYAPLISGCTTVFYEGKPVRTPDAGAFWRVCEEYKVKALFAAPTAFRAIKKEDPDAKLLQDYDLSQLERIFMAGERLDPPTLEWVLDKVQVPVLDHWWQTETGWAITCNPIGLETFAVKPGLFDFANAGLSRSNSE